MKWRNLAKQFLSKRRSRIMEKMISSLNSAVRAVIPVKKSRKGLEKYEAG